MVGADLEKLGIDQPMAVLLRMIQLTNGLHSDFGQTATISDQRNDLAYLRADPLGPATVRYNPGAVLDELRAQGLASFGELERLLQDAERVHYRIPDFPFRWLKLEGGESDWQRLAILMTSYESEKSTGSKSERGVLEEMIAVFPRHPTLLLGLAQRQLDRAQYSEAIETLKRFQAIEPDEVAGAAGMSAAYLGLGEPERALKLARSTLAGHHESAFLHLLEADALEALGRPIEALGSYDRALALEPDNLGALRKKAALLDRMRGANSGQ